MPNTASVARACRACLAGLAGTAFIILSAPLAEAEYSPRVTIGNNYQQTSTTLSPNGIDQGSCNSFNCYVLFQRAPQEKSLIIQHVSCAVLPEGSTVALGALANRKGQSQSLLGTTTYLVPVHQAGDVWLVNNPVMHLVRSGERAVIAFQASPGGNWSIACNISGKLQQP